METSRVYYLYFQNGKYVYSEKILEGLKCINRFESVSIQRENEIYRKAKEYYIKTTNMNYNSYLGMCACINKQVDSKWDRRNHVYVFSCPEFVKLAIKKRKNPIYNGEMYYYHHMLFNSFFWTPNDTKVRIRQFNKLIKATE